MASKNPNRFCPAEILSDPNSSKVLLTIPNAMRHKIAIVRINGLGGRHTTARDIMLAAMHEFLKGFSDSGYPISSSSSHASAAAALAFVHQPKSQKASALKSWDDLSESDDELDPEPEPEPEPQPIPIHNIPENARILSTAMQAAPGGHIPIPSFDEFAKIDDIDDDGDAPPIEGGQMTRQAPANALDDF
ncbi:MAG: hypothetical protein ACXWYM_00415 [Candidatus Binatia bacterium]